MGSITPTGKEKTKRKAFREKSASGKRGDLEGKKKKKHRSKTAGVKGARGMKGLRSSAT